MIEPKTSIDGSNRSIRESIMREAEQRKKMKRIEGPKKMNVLRMREMIRMREDDA